VVLGVVASPSEAVFDYYELESRRGRDGGWRRLEPGGGSARLVLSVRR
jgi:hypothetical protein